MKAGVIVSYWFTWWSCDSPAVSLCSHGEPMGAEVHSSIPSCLLYNPKFPASWLLSLPTVFMLVSSLAYSTLKMEAICSSKTSVHFQRTTWHYIPEGSTLPNHRCENLKSYKLQMDFHIFLQTAIKWKHFTEAQNSIILANAFVIV
jgi:hypothetical protein